MAARAMWKATLKAGSTDIPVKLYAAIKDQTVHFHMLEESTMSRVHQRMANSATGKEVPHDEIQKGYEIEPGTYVLVNDDELEALNPKASRRIEITRFVRGDGIDSQWYDRPYYLGPDGNEEAYFALAQALENTGREGIAKWVMRDKAYIGALRAQEGYLILITLRHSEEVISASDLPALAGRAPDKKELTMAKQLIGMLDGEFDPAAFRDEYSKRVAEFVATKASGKAPRLAAARSKRATSGLSNALAKSIESLKKEKTAA